MREKHTLLAALGSLALQLTALQQASAADDKASRAKLVTCVNAELQNINTDGKGTGSHLTDDQLKRFQEIIDREIMTNSLEKKTKEEQHKIFESILAVAKKELKEVPRETLDKLLLKLKEKALHCSTKNK